MVFCRARGIKLAGALARLKPDRKSIAILSREVSKQRRQFEFVDDLKEALTLAWDAIDITIYKSLLDSMADRLVSVINARGFTTPS